MKTIYSTDVNAEYFNHEQKCAQGVEITRLFKAKTIQEVIVYPDNPYIHACELQFVFTDGTKFSIFNNDQCESGEFAIHE